MTPPTKYARVETLQGARWVEVVGESLFVLDGAPWLAGVRRTAEVIDARQAKWLACSEASKVVCVGQNYRKHAAEMGKPVPSEPLLFTKPSTALNGHLSPIVLPPASQEVHHECEVGLVIGERVSKADVAQAAKAIFAVTCFNDVTARDIQKRETQHTRAKGYDTFACAGPWMVKGLDPSDLRVLTRVNGVTKQDGRSSDMVFDAPTLVSFMSQVMTLLPGDLIATGTPFGVGPLVEGDVVEIEVEGVGVLKNPVRR